MEAPHCLSRLLSVKDVTLFPALARGVPTAYDKEIPASHVFSPQPTDVQPEVDLQIYEGNWAGAEALQTWGSKVAVGKMNIVHSEGSRVLQQSDFGQCASCFSSA